MTEKPVKYLKIEEENLSDWQNQWWTISQEGFDEDVQPEPRDEPLVVTASGDFCHSA